MFKNYIVENNPIYINNNRKIYNGITTDNEPVLLKLFIGEYNKNNLLSMITNEENVLRDIEGFCKIKSINTTEHNPYVVYEKKQGQTLYSIYSSTELSFTAIIDLFVKLVDSIDAIHCKGYVHGHLNPNSVYISDENTNIYNTGIYLANNNRLPYISSSTYYCSSEMKKNEPMTYASDIYSLGKILLFLCTGKEPAISIKNDKEYIKIIMNNCSININSAKNLYNYIVKATSELSEDRYSKIKYLKRDLFSIIRSIKNDLNELLFLNNDFYTQFEFTDVIIGRDIELNRVKRTFLSDDGISIISIQGESGVGKTEFSIACLKTLDGLGATSLVIDISLEKIDSKNSLYNYLIKEIQEKLNHKTKSYHKCNFSEEPKLILQELLQYDVFKKLIPALYIVNIDCLNEIDKKEILFELENIPFNKGIVIIESNKKSFETGYKKILLCNFSIEQLKQFVSSSISMGSDTLSRFCNICYRKTLGNPYYLKDFMNRLYLNGILWYNYNLSQYDVEFDKIDNVTITNNLKDQIIIRIDKLNEKEKYLLKHLYCVGYQFELKDIFFIMNEDKILVLQMIKKFISLEILYLIDGIVSEYYWKTNSYSNIITKFKFICKEVYNYITAIFSLNEEINMHYKIVNKYYIENKDKDFIAQNMKRSWLLVENQKLKDFYIITLFNKASRFFYRCDYSKSLDYLKIVLHLLDKNIWRNNYTFAINFYNLLIKTAYYSRNYFLVERYKYYVLNNIKNFEDSEVVNKYSIQSMLIMGDRNEAWKCSIDFLDKMGFSIKSGKTDPFCIDVYIMKYYFKYKKDKLLSSDYIVNRRHQIIIKFITETLMYQVLTSKPDFLPIIILKVLKIIKKWGISANISYLIVLWFGYCSKRDKKFENLRFSCKISKKMSFITGDGDNCQLLTSLGLYYPGFKPLKESIKTLKKGYAIGERNRDYLWSSYSIYEARCLSIYESYNLALLVTDINTDIINLKDIGNTVQINNMKILLKTCNIITGKEIQQDLIDFDDMSPGASTNINILLQKATTSLIFNQSNFPELSRKIYRNIGICNSLYNEFLCRYYYVLALLLKNKNSVNNHLEIIRNILLIRRISHYAPWNFRHKYLFIKGYYLVRINNQYNGFWLLDEAVMRAKKENNHWDVGFFCERISDLSMRYKRKNLSNYILESYNAYRKWGAIAKCRQILNNNKNLFNKNKDHINTKIKPVKSYTFTYDKAFYQQLLRNIVKKINGDFGYIIIKRDGELFIDLVGDSLRNQYDNIKNHKLGQLGNLPTKLIEEIDKTRETIIINKSSILNDFSNNNFNIDNKIKSVVAGPLVFKDYYIGVYYIENRIKEHSYQVDGILDLKSSIELISSYIYNYIIFPEKNKTHELMKIVNEKDEEIKKLKKGKILSKSEIISKLDYEIKMFNRYKEIFSVITVNILPMNDSDTSVFYDFIKKSIRNIDTIIEMNPNHYILILPKTDYKGGDILINKIKRLKQIKKIEMDIVFNLFEYREGYNVKDIIKEISIPYNIKIV